MTKSYARALAALETFEVQFSHLVTTLRANGVHVLTPSFGTFTDPYDPEISYAMERIHEGTTRVKERLLANAHAEGVVTITDKVS